MPGEEIHLGEHEQGMRKTVNLKRFASMFFC